MLHILHAADLHLDAPFAGLPPEKAAQRRAEQRQLLTRLADLARTRSADLLLLSGDLLDGGAAYAETADALAQALAHTACPVLIAPGNHDFWSPRGPYATLHWPDNVHIFSSPDMTGVDLARLNCTVWGAAFSGPYREDSPLADFAVPVDGRIHLGVLHGEVGARGRYAPIAERDIGDSGLTYLALGHIHACSGLCRARETYWAYPGCPEGRGFDETGEKGALWITLDSGQVQAEFIPLNGRRYEIMTVDVTGGAEQALRSALPPAPCGHICRILLTGERDLSQLALAPLEALAAPCFYSVELRDKTTIRRDLWSRVEEDTLTGLFLRRMQCRLSEAEPQEIPRLEDAVRFGLAALENGEDRA